MIHSVVLCMWQYGKADWEGLQEQLAAADWNRIERVDVHEGARYLTDKTLEYARDYIYPTTNGARA